MSMQKEKEGIKYDTKSGWEENAGGIVSSVGLLRWIIFLIPNCDSVE